MGGEMGVEAGRKYIRLQNYLGKVLQFVWFSRGTARFIGEGEWMVYQSSVFVVGLYQFQMKNTETFIIVRNYRQSLEAQRTRGLKKKKEEKKPQQTAGEEQKIEDTRLQAKKTKRIFKHKFPQVEPILGEILEVPYEQLDDGPINTPLPVMDLEEDPFIEQSSNEREYTEPHKIDHQDSTMTQDQIRQIDSYFTF